MTDEQPNTLSTDVTASDAETVSAGSDEQSGQESSKAPNWWDRLTGRLRGESQEAEHDGEDPSRDGKAPKPLTLTEEELERKVQSETDRREAKRLQEYRAQQKRELRDKDPWAYAEEERKAEQVQQSTGQLESFLAGIGSEHDRVSIDPVIEILPEAERKRILSLENAGRGLEGRKLVVTEALKALEKHWKAEGEKAAEGKLRRNPAFRKQILAETRGGSVEPELLPASGISSSDADKTVSSLLRTYYDLPAPSSHNNAG